MWWSPVPLYSIICLKGVGGPILFRGDSLVVRTFVSLIHTWSRQGVLVVLAVLRIVGKFVPYPYLETYPYKTFESS